MNTTSIGRQAEAAAADYLKRQGYEILVQNWRRPACEIDIVAKKKKVIYFVEVKYRTSSAQGAGLDYITAKKLQQMERAANFWVAENSWKGDYRLAAVEVKANNWQPIVEAIVEI